ncbi:hypothetical protein B0H17DRAFT_1056801 [Mycena rosella]|uniref:Uncharacterized protein n=1 Tax=Mycena rosella TaxID=1033263 RepID=A0AAD7DMH9_MYCRO|nr:hypothetical protein B0H17DRAFT_1056801 [Mycena rosella]
MADSDSRGPIFEKDTPYSEWQSDAKAFLRRKEVWKCCKAVSTDEVANEKCAGILWGLLSKDVKPLVKQHEDNPKALWDALETLFSPRKAGAHFNAYRTLTSIHLHDNESLLSLTGRVSAAMRLLKGSRTAGFTLDKADEELQAVVLLMALPDNGQYAILKAPFEQSSDDLKVSTIEQVYANHQAFRTAHQEGDTSQISLLSGAAMAATSTRIPPIPTASSAALATAPLSTKKTGTPCPACGKGNHPLLLCHQFLELIGKREPKGAGASSSNVHVASNTQAPHCI